MQELQKKIGKSTKKDIILDPQLPPIPHPIDDSINPNIPPVQSQE